MGFRGILRDALSIYLGIEIVRGYLLGQFFILNISVAGLLLFILALWFLLERVGIIPKFS